jgi:hypothetical protein
MLAWLEKQGNKDEEILVLKDQIESLHAAIRALKEAHKIELKKQDEQKSAWSEEDEKMMSSTVFYLNEFKEGYQEGAQKCISWLKSLKDRVHPKHEWSEEDEMKRNYCIHLLEGQDSHGAEECVGWLKSLKHQSQWKPSERQIYLLNWVANILLKDDGIVEKETAKELRQLLEQLKKLREE